MTQATIDQTICVSGWTATVRPPESVTDSEKRASMLAYADHGATGSYEYDHLIPLELGGAVNDPRNLWPEPGGSPNVKDSVENALRRLVCDGRMQLISAQQTIARDWVAWAKAHGFGAQSGGSSGVLTPPSSPAPASSSTGPNKPISEINCSDFPTHALAQRWFDSHGGSPSNDVAGLDHDHDGVACESLP